MECETFLCLLTKDLNIVATAGPTTSSSETTRDPTTHTPTHKGAGDHCVIRKIQTGYTMDCL